MENETTRKTAVAQDEKIKAAVAYGLGFITGIAVLLIAKDNERVKFHAWQSVLGSLIISAFGNFVLMSIFVGSLLEMLLTVWLFTIVAYLWYGGYRVFSGKGFRIPLIADLVEIYIVRSVAGDDNARGAVAYLLGFVTGAIVLADAKNDRRVKFHALQSTIWSLAVGIIGFGGFLWLASLPAISPTLAALVFDALWIGLFMTLLYMAYRAHAGASLRIPVIGRLVEQCLV